MFPVEEEQESRLNRSRHAFIDTMLLSFGEQMPVKFYLQFFMGTNVIDPFSYLTELFCNAGFFQSFVTYWLLKKYVDKAVASYLYARS